MIVLNIINDEIKLVSVQPREKRGLRFQTTGSKHRSFSRHKTTQTLNLDDQKQGRHQDHRGDERINRHFDLLLRAFNANGAAALDPRIASPPPTRPWIRRTRTRTLGTPTTYYRRNTRPPGAGFATPADFFALNRDSSAKRTAIDRFFPKSALVGVDARLAVRPSARGRIPTNATRQSSRRIATRIASKRDRASRASTGGFIHSFIRSFVRSTFARASSSSGSRAREPSSAPFSRAVSPEASPSRGARGGEHKSTRRRGDADDRGHTCVCH